MRIGVDATPLSFPQTGVGTYTANLIRALAERGGDEVVPLLYRDVHPSFAAELRGSPVAFRPEGGRWPMNSVAWMHWALRRRVRRSSFDVCHFTNSAAPWQLDCPYVLTIHDAGLWLHPEHHPARRLLALRPVVPRAARRADAVITVSHAVKEELVEVLGLAEDKVRVVHPGVSPRFHRVPLPEELARTRQSCRLPERFVLCVGALEPRKNLLGLLAAHATVTSEPALRDVGLVFVGPLGWKNAPFERAIAGRGPGAPVRVLGPVDGATLVALYHLAAVLAFPSFYEGFGLPVVEAMACGTPVVTSNRGALAEVAGDAAELVDPTRVDGIAAGLRRVLEDPRHREALRQRGTRRARAFTWERAAEQTRAIYAEITGVDA